MRTIHWLPLLAVLAAANARARPSTSVLPVNQPLIGPQAALERLADGYRDLSLDSVAASLTADYRFHSMMDSLTGFVFGSARDEELGVVRGLLHGVVKGADTLMAPADSVGMILDGILENVDPEHPDSTQHYRVLSVKRFDFGWRTTKGLRVSVPSNLEIFHVVRGDVAQLLPGQPADSTRWYVRRWLEDVTVVNAELRQRQGDCGEEPAPAPGPRSAAAGRPAVPSVLAVRPLANPACAKLEVRCDLPGLEPARVEVYDVSGRRVNQRQVAVAAAGTLTIEAGRGATLYPGVYWVRVGQGLRPPATRMFVVAR
jgi:hypothetical protein